MKRPPALASLVLASLALAGLVLPSALALQEPRAEPEWTQEELERATERIRGQIEALRGEAFLRPVAVRLTDGEGFLRHMHERMEEFLPEGELEIEESVAKLLGLVPPEMNLWQVTEELLEGQVGGFYDPGKDTFYLMESFAGGMAEVILAHELTHALDDQLYDIDGKLERLLENTDATNAYQAVVEGSGTSLMTTWMLKHGRELDPADLEAAMSMGQEGLDAAPAYLWKPLLFAYLGGQRFLNRGYRLRDKQAGEELKDVVREAFVDTPRSTEQVLHPDKYWKQAERDEPRALVQEAAELPAGWELVGRRTLGELTLALLTDDWAQAASLDPTDPLQLATLRYTNEAAEGWGGDSLAFLRKDGARLARLATVWDRPEDAQEFRAALERNRAEWERRLAALDEGGHGSGLELLPGDQPDALTVVAWTGASEAEALAVAAALHTKELEPELEPAGR